MNVARRAVTSLRSWSAATLAAAATVIVPSTTALYGTMQKNRDLELQGSRFQHEAGLEQMRLTHEARLRYLEAMRYSGQDLRVLRLVIATAPDPVVHTWAETELRRAETELAAQRQEQERLDSAAAAAWQEALVAAAGDRRQISAIKLEMARHSAQAAMAGPLRSAGSPALASEN